MGSGMIAGVTGGRGYRPSLDELGELVRQLKSEWVARLVHGGCRGVDLDCARAAQEAGITVQSYPADWAKHGKAAGPIRNAEMAKVIGILFAFPGGRGTADMVRRCKGRQVRIVQLTG